MTPSAMDYTRAALANAAASGLTLADVMQAAEHAATPEAFDRAVNILGDATPDPLPWWAPTAREEAAFDAAPLLGLAAYIANRMEAP